MVKITTVCCSPIKYLFLNCFFLGLKNVEIDTHGFCGWTTDEIVEHGDGQDKKDWTGVSGGPGSQTYEQMERKTVTMIDSIDAHGVGEGEGEGGRGRVNLEPPQANF
jgi:hypothetical protein